MQGNIKLYSREVAMNVREELLFDFSINMPRLLVSGQTCIVDNVKKIVFITETSIIVDNGQRFSAINGDRLRVKMIEEERMIVTGELHSIEFYPGKKGELHEE
jgi:sporulation protein YqfC